MTRERTLPNARLLANQVRTLLKDATQLYRPSRLFKLYDIDSLDNRDEELIATLHRWYGRALKLYFRADVRGLERIPPGAGLYVGNHNGSTLGPEPYLFGIAVYERYGLGEAPYGLGHEVAIRLPLAHQLLLPLGAVRASHENAHRLFAHGRKVLVYPGGDLDANRPFRKRNRIVFGGRRGYIRLAIREGVPIIPVVSAGAHSVLIILDDMRWLARALRLDRLLRLEVWPLTLSIPWGLTVGPPMLFIPFPSRVLLEILEPIHFERSGIDAAGDEDYVRECGRRVENAMQDALNRLAGELRKRPGPSSSTPS